MDLTRGKATICVVNYKTEELTRLCLRSIRKFTRYPYEVIVVDNDSGDSSLDYLRSLSWIRLIERPGEMEKSGSWAHGTALDKGLAACENEFFIAMHSDTFVHKEGWLSELANFAKPDIACVGGGKLDLKPRWLTLLKQMTDIKKWLRKTSPGKKEKFYIRTICALYRTEILKQEDLSFIMGVADGFTCGKKLYLELLKHGCSTLPLSEHQMAGYIYHLAHTTMVLNPEFSVRKRTEIKYRRKIEQIMASPVIQQVMQDDSLDQ